MVSLTFFILAEASKTENTSPPMTIGYVMPLSMGFACSATRVLNMTAQQMPHIMARGTTGVPCDGHHRLKRHAIKASNYEYRTWFPWLLASTDPMIIFLAPYSKWSDWPRMVQRQRQYAPTIIAYLPYESFVMSTHFSDELWYAEAFTL